MGCTGIMEKWTETAIQGLELGDATPRDRSVCPSPIIKNPMAEKMDMKWELGI